MPRWGTIRRNLSFRKSTWNLRGTTKNDSSKDVPPSTSLRSETKYIQPVYRFIGKGYTSDGEESKFTAVTSMINEEDTASDDSERKSRNTKKVIE